MKNKKFQVFSLIIIFMLLVLSMIITFRIISKGVYDGRCFIGVWILVVLGWYLTIFKGSSVRFRQLSIMLLVILSLAIPLVLIQAKPFFSYNEGARLVYFSLELSSDYILKNDDIDLYTIPVDMEKEVFSRKLYYYYYFSDGLDDVYFMMDPYTGRVEELLEEWPLDIKVDLP